MKVHDLISRSKTRKNADMRKCSFGDGLEFEINLSSIKKLKKHSAFLYFTTVNGTKVLAGKVFDPKQTEVLLQQYSYGNMKSCRKFSHLMRNGLDDNFDECAMLRLQCEGKGCLFIVRKYNPADFSNISDLVYEIFESYSDILGEIREYKPSKESVSSDNALSKIINAVIDLLNDTIGQQFLDLIKDALLAAIGISDTSQSSSSRSILPKACNSIEEYQEYLRKLAK